VKIYVATMEAIRKDRMKFSLGTYRQNPWFPEFLKIFKELVLTYNHGSQKHMKKSKKTGQTQNCWFFFLFFHK